MVLHKVVRTVVIAALCLLSTGALSAKDWKHGNRYYKYGRGYAPVYRGYYGPRYYVRPRPVVVYGAVPVYPRVYYSEPIYYPEPVYYAPPPPRLSIGVYIGR